MTSLCLATPKLSFRFLPVASRTITTLTPRRSITKQIFKINQTNYYTSSTRTFSKMSFSNADTGSKPSDPYKEKNLEDASLKDKVEDLVNFAEKCKFCMMTTRIADSGLLVSRCMAMAAKVDIILLSSKLLLTRYLGREWDRPSIPRKFRIRKNR
jgi:hypothetical protein